MRSWIAIWITLFCFCLFPANGLADGSEQEKPAAGAGATDQMAPENRPDAFFPQAKHTFEAVIEGAVVLHSFVLQNRGKATLDVKEVKTS